MIDNGLYDEGYVVVIAPALNYHVQDATEAYHAHLREPQDGKVRVVNLTLEDVIEVIRLSDQAHAKPCIAATATSGWSTASWN
jgi:hypothetical protein